MHTMRHLTQAARLIGAAWVCLGLAAGAFAQATAQGGQIEIPPGVTTLEGVPSVRIDASEAGATRHALGAPEAVKERLVVSVVDGEYFWTSRDNRPLRLSRTGEFTYLSATPGAYIRLTRLNDRITYVEHVDKPSGSVTWWGELRFVVGK